MLLRALRKTLATLAVALLVVTAVPQCPAAASDVIPIGTLATSGSVSIGASDAPTGTTVFSGDHLSAQDAPALISLQGGSSVSLTRGAAATFIRQGSTLLVRAETGTIGFRFAPRQEVRMEAGPYRFTASAPDRAKTGEITINSDGLVTMALNSGAFAALDTKTGRPFDMSAPVQTASKTPPTGTGSLVNDSNAFSDPKQRWVENSLKNKCIVARGESHRILANKSNVLVIAGSWLLFSGTYDYTITECTEAALENAGAAIGVNEALQPPTATAGAGAAANRGMSAGAKAGIILAVAGGGGAGAAVALSSRKSKSP
jgi:hypothetical protein